MPDPVPPALRALLDPTRNLEANPSRWVECNTIVATLRAVGESLRAMRKFNVSRSIEEWADAIEQEAYD